MKNKPLVDMAVDCTSHTYINQQFVRDALENAFPKLPGDKRKAFIGNDTFGVVKDGAKHSKMYQTWSKKAKTVIFLEKKSLRSRIVGQS